MYVKHAFRRYFKWFETVEKKNENYVSKACIPTIIYWFETVEKKNENYVSKACIPTIFEAIINFREKMETLYRNHAFWRNLKRFGIAEKKMKTRTLKMRAF